ncbi:MAG: hypothetical protein KGL39_33040 [Patescibacteria group bacterium]|nr:hypothetical protein [Patescibacteria group bacterium]
MPRKIVDEFTDQPISRELKRRLRKNKAGLCGRAGCSAAAGEFTYCPEHRAAEVERKRTRAGKAEAAA